jgi:hypothetical protein
MKFTLACKRRVSRSLLLDGRVDGDILTAAVRPFLATVTRIETETGVANAKQHHRQRHPI